MLMTDESAPLAGKDALAIGRKPSGLISGAAQTCGAARRAEAASNAGRVANLLVGKTALGGVAVVGLGTRRRSRRGRSRCTRGR
jgi:hypothetical protein